MAFSALLAEQLGAEPMHNGNALKSAWQFNLLAESIAHLSFIPGGCRAFGLQFEASPLPAEPDEQHGQAIQEVERTVLSSPTNKRKEKPKQQRKETPTRQMRLFSAEEQ